MKALLNVLLQLRVSLSFDFRKLGYFLQEKVAWTLYFLMHLGFVGLFDY